MWPGLPSCPAGSPSSSQTYPLSTKAIWSWMKTPLFSSPQASGGSAGTRWICSYLVFSEETGRGEPGGTGAAPPPQPHTLLIPLGAALGHILGTGMLRASPGANPRLWNAAEAKDA